CAMSTAAAPTRIARSICSVSATASTTISNSSRSRARFAASARWCWSMATSRSMSWCARRAASSSAVATCRPGPQTMVAGAWCPGRAPRCPPEPGGVVAMLDAAALDVLFREAHTANAFTTQPVTDADLHQVFDLLRMAPTSANSQPGRFVFVRSAAAKKRLEPALSAGNRAKTMAAPVTVIVAHDMRFHEFLPRVFPHDPGAVGWFEGEAKRASREITAFRNGTLQ